MENRETFFFFCEFTLHTLQHITREHSIHGTTKLREEFPTQVSTGTPEVGKSDGDQDTIPTPRFLRSSSARESNYPTEGRNFKNYGADQQRLQNLGSAFRQIHFFTHVFVLENKVHDRSLLLFKVPNRSNACGSKK